MNNFFFLFEIFNETFSFFISRTVHQVLNPNLKRHNVCQASVGV